MTHTPPPSSCPERVVIRDATSGKWLEFTTPRAILTTHRLDEVMPLLQQLEERVEQEGLHAAGFISYEAAPAFDPALSVKADGPFPLLWFGLFQQVNEITLHGEDREPLPQIDWQPSVTNKEYHRCLDAIRACIRDGETYQVNFTYRLRAETGIDPWRLFVHIAGNTEMPYAGFVDTDEWAVCSASPELFFRLDGMRIESRPMKGTAARGLWFGDDREKRNSLLCSEKERAENVMITDMVRNDLGRVALAGSVQTPSLFTVEQYPTVWQLTSTVAAQTSQPLARILQATFPPASITGAPKRRTMKIIAGLESSPRRIYTGTLGFVAPGRRVQFNVAIRTVLLHKPTGRAEYGVGGGILWDSTPMAEYEESLTKTRALKPLPRDFDLLETLVWSPNGGYTLLERHLERLAGSAAYFAFRADMARVRHALSDLAAGFPGEPHRVRLVVSRSGNILCEAVPLQAAAQCFPDPVPAKKPVDSRDIFLYHKTTRRMVYEDALRMCPHNQDVLLFNQDGEITETTMANIAIEQDGALYTPPVRCGLLPGTHRAWLISRGHLQERILYLRDVLASPHIYLMNSVRGLHEVRMRASEKNSP